MTTKPLSASARDLLARLGDGITWNILAYPFWEEIDSIPPALRLVWDGHVLVDRGLAESIDNGGSGVWLRITDAGKQYLRELAP